MTGAPCGAQGLKDVYWLGPESREMTDADWQDGGRRTLGMQFGNDAPDGQRFLLLMNAWHEPVPFKLAEDFPSARWASLFDTGRGDGLVRDYPAIIEPGQSYEIPARTLVLFRHEG